MREWLVDLQFSCNILHVVVSVDDNVRRNQQEGAALPVCAAAAVPTGAAAAAAFGDGRHK